MLYYTLSYEYISGMSSVVFMYHVPAVHVSCACSSLSKYSANKNRLLYFSY